MDNFMVTLLNALLIPLTVISKVFVLAAMIKTPSLLSPSSTVFLCSQYNCLRSCCWFGCTTDLHWIQTQPRGPALQHVFNILSSLGSGASLCTMIAISVDRFLSLIHLRYPNLMTEKGAIYPSTSIWLIVMITLCLSLWNLTYANLVYAPTIAICVMISTVV